MSERPLFKPVIFLLKKLSKFQVIGAEKIPPQGGLMMTANHLSRLDVPFLMAITERTDLVAIVAKKYQKKAFFKWILEKIGEIVWVDRQNIDFQAIRQVLDYLRSGKVVGIAPEGTRSRGSVGLLEGKEGSAVMASRASVPILPVGIFGTEKINDCWKKLRRPSITVRIGAPYYLPEFDQSDRQNWLSQSTDEIMCRIAVLLPPEYRGFYTDHPRLQQLLAEGGDL